MPPETTQKPEVAQPPVTAPSPAKPAETAATPSVPAAPIVQPNTAAASNSPLPSALQPTDGAFNSLQPEKDIWRLIWRAAYGLNYGLATLFIVFMILNLLNAGSSEFSAGAIGTPFWILPLLILADMIFVGAYYVIRRPKLGELGKLGMWLGISFAAAFLAAIAYIVVQTVI
jgi:hypothetical protein